jgi:hypothetical protein
VPADKTQTRRRPRTKAPDWSQNATAVGKSCLWIAQNRKRNTQIYERLHVRLNGLTSHDFSVIGKRDKPKENHARKI